MIIKENTRERIRSSQTAESIFRKIIDERPQEEQHKEYFYMMGLNQQNKVVIIDLITIGSINSCGVAIREVFRMAIIKDCASIICCHNHPSGNIEPSQEDKTYTKELIKAGKIIGVRVLDHIIIGNSYFSFADYGLMG